MILIYHQALVRMDRHISYEERMQRVDEVINEVSCISYSLVIHIFFLLNSFINLLSTVALRDHAHFFLSLADNF